MDHLRVRAAIVLSALAVCMAVLGPVAAQVADPDPTRFAADIKSFADQDRRNTPPADAVLFVGSSSIRLWPTAERFPGLAVINRGFGGSHISDVNHYIRETVLKYRPRIVLLYAGDNDIGAGKSPQRLLGDYQAFVEAIQRARADTDVIFIAVKPSLARWTLWPSARAFNELVRDYSASRPTLHFLDVAPPMLGADGKPKPELFVEDGLHMTPAGYDIWTDEVNRAIAPLLRR